MAKVYIVAATLLVVLGGVFYHFTIGEYLGNRRYQAGFEAGVASVPQATTHHETGAKRDTIRITIRRLVRDTVYQSDPDQIAQITELQAFINSLTEWRQDTHDTVFVPQTKIVEKIDRFGIGPAGSYHNDGRWMGGIGLRAKSLTVMPMVGSGWRWGAAVYWEF